MCPFEPTTFEITMSSSNKTLILFVLLFLLTKVHGTFHNNNVNVTQKIQAMRSLYSSVLFVKKSKFYLIKASPFILMRMASNPNGRLPLPLVDVTLSHRNFN